MSGASGKRLDCLKDLIRNARNNKFSVLRKLAKDEQDVYDVWDGVSQIIEYHMKREKAVQVPGLGTFTFTSSKLDIGHNKFILIQRPVFILSEKLARTHHLKQSKYHVPGEIPVLQLNFMALSYELNLDRDLVEASIKEVVNVLSRSIEQCGCAEFGLTTVGNLVINNGEAKMKFLPSFVENLDQTGGLAKYLSKRPGTCNSILLDKSLVLPKIQPGEDIKESSSKTDIYIINEEHEDSQVSDTQKCNIIEVGKGSPQKTKKEAIVPALKVEHKAPVIQQFALSSSQESQEVATPLATPRRSFKGKKTVHYKDPRHEVEPKMSSDQPKSKVNLVALLKGTSSSLSPRSKLVQDNSNCDNCSENMTDFCYLCYQREKRNVPCYFDEQKRKEEEEEDRILQMYTLMKDSEALKNEQESKVEKRKTAQKIASLNLTISETLKKKKERRPTEFHRSYVFRQRPITPPHYIKQENYREDLANQVYEKSARLKDEKLAKETAERLEQMQLADDLAKQRNYFLKSKRVQSDEYKKSLDTQLMIRSSELPAAYPDSDGPIFGRHDMDDVKEKERRKRARSLYLNQMSMAGKKRDAELQRDMQKKKGEEEMLRKTRSDLLKETLARSNINLRQRQDLEKTWALHALNKRTKELEERLYARTPGLLLQEQCDKYPKCAQCPRKITNCGQSNVWAETRYVSGSRLMNDLVF